MKYRLILLATLFLIGSCSQSRQLPKNAYGLKIIETKGDYNIAVKDSGEMEMVDVKSFAADIKLDLRYSTDNNFVGKKLYPSLSTTYLRKSAAEGLAAVQLKLKTKNLSLKIWDAYRPYAVTEEMWKIVPDSRYAANPQFGSGHNRGISVDLTIINTVTGKELDMGTGFDNFSDTAHSTYTNLPKEILANRTLLKNMMEQEGFIVLDTEWWHFYLPDSKKYTLMNLSFKQLKELTKQ
jgi:D-alanyl-D-alanine dipeptidase